MANVAWSTIDKSANVTISGATNLVATATAGGGYARATSGQSNGKVYFEVTHTAIGSASLDESGLALPGATPLTNSIGQIYLTTGGLLKINSSSAVANLGASITAGTVVGWAIDFDNQRVWCRIGAAGNWNGNAGNTPATPSTGASFAAIGAVGISLLPFMYSSANGTSVTANFGDTAFAGTVPTGYASGVSTTGVNNALITQEGAEIWRVGPANLQFTQLGSEVWRNGPANVQVTQLGVEVWRSVAIAPGVTNIPAFGAILS